MRRRVAESPILDAIAYEILSLCFSFSSFPLNQAASVSRRRFSVDFALTGRWTRTPRAARLVPEQLDSRRSSRPLSLATEAIRRRPGGRRASPSRSLPAPLSLRPRVRACDRAVWRLRADARFFRVPVVTAYGGSP
ncbi:hypothetical protein QQF64_002920 [Cirrhinus molitorella]|uniref:Uncharacterized protein n=1 Tax=Cirrhinus molitorella TaxID=172907 RepID=A0ABR3MRK0_9TELE